MIITNRLFTKMYDGRKHQSPESEFIREGESANQLLHYSGHLSLQEDPPASLDFLNLLEDSNFEPRNLLYDDVMHVDLPKPASVSQVSIKASTPVVLGEYDNTQLVAINEENVRCHPQQQNGHPLEPQRTVCCVKIPHLVGLPMKTSFVAQCPSLLLESNPSPCQNNCKEIVLIVIKEGGIQCKASREDSTSKFNSSLSSHFDSSNLSFNTTQSAASPSSSIMTRAAKQAGNAIICHPSKRSHHNHHRISHKITNDTYEERHREAGALQKSYEGGQLRSIVKGGLCFPPLLAMTNNIDKTSDAYRDRRARNNIAVKKCRENAKMRSKGTEQRITILEKENERLKNKIRFLTSELILFRSLTYNNELELPEKEQLEFNDNSDFFQSQIEFAIK